MYNMNNSTTTTLSPTNNNYDIDESKIYILYVCTVAFFAVALFCVYEFFRNHTKSGNNNSNNGPNQRDSNNNNRTSIEESNGWATRKVFHLLLFVANLSRGIALVVEILLQDSLAKKDAWFMSLAHAFPDLAFLSTYSFLVLFFAQLYYSSQGRVVANLHSYFFFANASVYLVCVVIAIYTGPTGSSRYAQFRLILEYVLGSIFAISGLGVLYYGCSIIKELEKSGAVTYPEQRTVLKRVRIACLVCVTLFLSRAIYGMVFAAHSSADMGYPHGWQRERYLVDGIEYALVELIPSVVILCVTRRRTTGNNDRTRLLRTPGYENNGSSYPPAVIGNIRTQTGNNRTLYGSNDIEGNMNQNTGR